MSRFSRSWSKGKGPSWPATTVPTTAALRAQQALLLKQRALQIGFSSAGITHSETLFSNDDHLRDWLANGRDGPLHYMRNIFQRRDLYLQRIPELKSILVVTSSYPNHPGFQGNPSGKPSGRIARYAVGRDYHRVIRKQLKQLSSFLMEWAGPSAKTWIAVDTSPVPERVLAQAAGLGFIGKNTCLIQPRGGSYHLLAALLTNVELPSDVPIRWDCGSCTLCLQACPTQALVKPYQLDANRCISSVTIEQRSSIPENLRPLLKDWIFGCDICQEVCPYNKKPETAIPCQDFQPETGAGEKLPLDEILALRTESAFLRRFAGTPLMRAKREGLVRNAAVAAGNSQAPELSASLADAAQNDPSAIVREHAAWGFQQLQKSV